MRSILIIGLTSVSLLGGCAEKQSAVNSIAVQKSRTAVLEGYKNDCINEYGFSKEGSDLLAACIQSKDQSNKPQAIKKGKITNNTFENFNKILSKGSYTFKS